MPQERPVILNYNGGAFGPTPKTVLVRGGDTIVFTLGTLGAAPPGSKLKITLHDPQHFSTRVAGPGQPQGVVQHTPSESGGVPLKVGVKIGFAARTGYKCELTDANGVPLGPPFVSDDDGGGGIEPDTSTIS